MNYVIYNRVSTEDQGENGVSLEAMEASCRAFITSQDVVPASVEFAAHSISPNITR